MKYYLVTVYVSYDLAQEYEFDTNIELNFYNEVSELEPVWIGYHVQRIG